MSSNLTRWAALWVVLVVGSVRALAQVPVAATVEGWVTPPGTLIPHGPDNPPEIHPLGGIEVKFYDGNALVGRGVSNSDGRVEITATRTPTRAVATLAGPSFFVLDGRELLPEEEPKAPNGPVPVVEAAGTNDLHLLFDVPEGTWQDQEPFVNQNNMAFYLSRAWRKTDEVLSRNGLEFDPTSRRIIGVANVAFYCNASHSSLYDTSSRRVDSTAVLATSRSNNECYSTASESVITHEFGHHLLAGFMSRLWHSNFLSIANFGSVLHENVPDVFTVLVQNSPIVNRGFRRDDDPDASARDVRVGVPYAEECCHTPSFSAAFWEMREALAQSIGEDAANELLLDHLFRWLAKHRGTGYPLYSDSRFQEIGLQFLMIDDTQAPGPEGGGAAVADLSDLSPNAEVIWTAFGNYNLVPLKRDSGTPYTLTEIQALASAGELLATFDLSGFETRTGAVRDRRSRPARVAIYGMPLDSERAYQDEELVPLRLEGLPVWSLNTYSYELTGPGGELTTYNVRDTLAYGDEDGYELQPGVPGRLATRDGAVSHRWLVEGLANDRIAINDLSRRGENASQYPRNVGFEIWVGADSDLDDLRFVSAGPLSFRDPESRNGPGAGGTVEAEYQAARVYAWTWGNIVWEEAFEMLEAHGLFNADDYLFANPDEGPLHLSINYAANPEASRPQAGYTNRSEITLGRATNDFYNTATSRTVIAHEFAHYMVFGLLDERQPNCVSLAETVADIFAALLLDTPDLGVGLIKERPDAPFRSLAFRVRFPSQAEDPHLRALPFGVAVWNLRTRIGLAPARTFMLNWLLKYKESAFPCPEDPNFGFTQVYVDFRELDQTLFGGQYADDIRVAFGAVNLVREFGDEEYPFVRGDANGDGRMDISDAIAILRALFTGTVHVPCNDAADVDDNGLVEITDPIRVLGHLFSGFARPPAPYPSPGEDPTADGLDCDFYPTT